MGRADYLQPNTWNALCDRCGFKYKANELREEWTGWMVCERCWEPRHEQDFLKGHKDEPNVPWTRPDSNANTSVITVDGSSLVTDNYYDIVNDAGKTLTKHTDNDVQDYVDPLTNTRVVILDTANAQNGDRFIINKTEHDDNKLVITSTVLDSGNTV